MIYSFIIPVFNRPDEIRELLGSFIELKGDIPYEIIIIEDGSELDSEAVVQSFADRLPITYLKKQNTGPGDSRNYGMSKANGEYFIILDSDCLLPKRYLIAAHSSLKDEFVDCYGGPDAAHPSFSNLQRAINFAMTSFISTGGVRGGQGATKNFEPRSFNMGLSKKAFDASKGFGRIHPGEDPDLVLRLKKLGFKTRLITEAFVYHKRRISWSKYFNQVHKFGLVRPILNHWHPKFAKAKFWLPTIFLFGFLMSFVFLVLGYPFFIIIYIIYFLLVFFLSFISEGNIGIAIKSVLAVAIQLFGYGYGFLKSFIAISLMGKNPETRFPELFFSNGR